MEQIMRGIVLAAGTGNRLRPITDHLPKALVPVGAGLTPLHLTLANFQAVGITSAVVVVGHLAHAVEAVREQLEDRYQISLRLVPNEKALVWNNAYSLLCALNEFDREDALLVNGDTVHPASFQRSLLDSATRGGAAAATLTLVVDDRDQMAEEEMKVHVTDGRVTTINKGLDPATAFGEYVGVSWLPGVSHDALIGALVSTVEADVQHYYEDGFQEYIDRGNDVRLVTTNGSAWTEIDDVVDLERAKEIVCQY
jgi:choline kinase